MTRTVTPEKLHTLADVIEQQDCVRQFWRNKSVNPESTPPKDGVRVFIDKDNTAARFHGQLYFEKALSEVIEKEWSRLFNATMEHIQRKVDRAAEDLGFPLNDPFKGKPISEYPLKPAGVNAGNIVASGGGGPHPFNCPCVICHNKGGSVPVALGETADH